MDDDAKGSVLDWIYDAPWWSSWAFGVWGSYFVSSLYSSVVANAIVATPYGAVVNTLFSVQLSICALLVLLALVLIVLSVLVGDYSDIPEYALAIPIYLLVPFAAVAGYSVYAHMARLDLVALSPVYAGFMRSIHAGLVIFGHVARAVSLPSLGFVGSERFFAWSNWIFGALGLLLTVQRTFLTRRRDRPTQAP
jgi:hypothetical protein